MCMKSSHVSAISREKNTDTHKKMTLYIYAKKHGMIISDGKVLEKNRLLHTL